MINPNEIAELEKYNNSKFEIMSVYLGIDSLKDATEKYLLTQFHSLLHQNLDGDQRNVFESDIDHIEKYLSEYVPIARSLVIFTGGNDLWKVIELEYSLPAKISIDTSPDIEPIQKSSEKYSKYMVLLIDREKARMLTVEQGVIVEHDDFVGGYVPQNKKMTGRDGLGSRTDMISRHTEVMLDRHIDLSVQAASEFARGQDINFLIIGGHAEMLARTAEALPYDLKNKLAGSFVIDVNRPLNDILIESKKIAASV